MNPIASLCPQWLRDSAALLRSKAHGARHAYKSDAIRPWMERVANAYVRAAAVLEVEADAMLADIAAARPAEPEPDGHREPDYGAPSAHERHVAAWEEKRRLS
jgi:hypothetical protein